MKSYYFKFAIAVFATNILLLGCKPTSHQATLPLCIDSKIETIKNEPVRNPPAEVWKWEANGTVYYYFNSPCCDQYNNLYNQSCELICAPDGGFTGKGDQKCPEFGDTVKKELVWKDERKKN